MVAAVVAEYMKRPQAEVPAVGRNKAEVVFVNKLMPASDTDLWGAPVHLVAGAVWVVVLVAVVSLAAEGYTSVLPLRDLQSFDLVRENEKTYDGLVAVEAAAQVLECAKSEVVQNLALHGGEGLGLGVPRLDA